MKRLALFVIAMMTVTAGFAQKGKVSAADTYLSGNDLDAAKKAIDAAMENEKSMNWPKTYITAAKVYTELYKNDKDDEGVMKAYDFYTKAIELDKKGNAKGKQKNKYQKEIKFALTFFKGDLTNAAIDAFNSDSYVPALNAFEGVINISAMDMFKEEAAGVDTAIVYNCALAAYNAEKWEAAEKYFDQSIDLKYGGGDAVLLLNQVYSNTEDSLKMGENLKRGFEVYPDDERILTSLIQFYLSSKQNEAALEYLNTAIEKDPENSSFYYARGVLYESTDTEKAIENYEKSLEIDGKLFNSLFNLGVIYYNKGVEQTNIANEKTDYKDFETAKKVADGFFEQALPYMEKALESEPTNADVLESLKGLYYRFERMDKYNEIKAKIESLGSN
ncbi:tetratricopeptide repeat protein [Marinilabiliaceae bacterium JC017]|nr:tetratricopeptide repeat protein [Marinilabiliaceae bacterium JC017]